MKNIIIQVFFIIFGISICVISASFIGYSIIKNVLHNDNNYNNQSVVINDNTDNNNTNTNTNTEVNIKKKKIEYNKLMIVAHPDDDTIFGGAHLIEDDYTVVCVTCGVVDYRLKEFEKAMKYSKDKYYYLSHTDLESNSIISNWEKEKDIIKAELKDKINSQDWDLIVTHNPEGEYGHKHHKMISEFVTNIVENKDKLYYFGKFKAKGTIDDTPTLNDKLFNLKKEMLSLYKSQPSCTNKGKLTYAFDHENWIKYNDWK